MKKKHDAFFFSGVEENQNKRSTLVCKGKKKGLVRRLS